MMCNCGNKMKRRKDVEEDRNSKLPPGFRFRAYYCDQCQKITLELVKKRGN